MWFEDRGKRRFEDLSEQEILALAIANEEEDSRVYQDIAARLPDYPATAAMFTSMAEEEDGHRRELIELYRKKFGEHIPLIRRGDVAGLMTVPQVWLQQPMDLGKVRRQAADLEAQNRRFYQLAAARSQDASIRKLLGDIALEEGSHEAKAVKLEGQMTGEAMLDEHETARKDFILQVIQPGLAGLIDGSVSTLAPLFAAAMATQSSHETFLVGLAASVGAGISMGLTEGMSDDGKISGRGSPWVRGGVCGVMTTIGGVGHSLPYLLPNVHVATGLAAAVVAVELAAIAWMRWKYMDTPIVGAVVQVLLGGALVVAVGMLLGSA